MTTSSPALPQKAPPRADFPALLEQSRGEISKLLPEHMDVSRVMRVALTAYRMDSKIRDCTPQSILASVMKACELGLEPGGALKHAWLVPYGKDCTFQVSYFGMLELARRSGVFRAIEARLVHERDRFHVAYTPEPEFSHIPDLGPDPGRVTHAYAYARLSNGALVLEVMSTEEVEHVRASSKCGPVWRNHWGEMAKKTVIKRMLKRQPCSIELAEVVDQDNREHGLIETTGRPAPTTLRGTAGLRERLEGPPPSPAEPEFTASEGVAQPLRTEADEPVPASEDEDPEGRIEEPE